jgi:hypothetical protein
MGVRGGLEPERRERPEPACLPLAPETDVLITLPIVSLASVLEAAPERGASSPGRPAGTAGSQRSQPTAGG